MDDFAFDDVPACDDVLDFDLSEETCLDDEDSDGLLSDIEEPYDWRLLHATPSPRLSLRMVASELLMVGLKQLPIAGTVVEAIDALRSRYERLRDRDQLARLEHKMTRIDRQVRGLIEHDIRATVQGLMQPDLDGPELEAHIRNLKSIRENGYDYALFEGLLQQSPHWVDLKRNPQNYGRVLPNTEQLRLSAVHIFIDADKTRILELTPFAFHALLTRQQRRRPQQGVETQRCASDVWAFPAN